MHLLFQPPRIRPIAISSSVSFLVHWCGLLINSFLTPIFDIPPSSPTYGWPLRAPEIAIYLLRIFLFRFCPSRFFHSRTSAWHLRCTLRASQSIECTKSTHFWDVRLPYTDSPDGHLWLRCVCVCDDGQPMMCERDYVIWTGLPFLWVFLSPSLARSLGVRCGSVKQMHRTFRSSGWLLVENRQKAKQETMRWCCINAGLGPECISVRQKDILICVEKCFFSFDIRGLWNAYATLRGALSICCSAARVGCTYVNRWVNAGDCIVW